MAIPGTSTPFPGSLASQYGFRGLFDQSGFFEGYGRRLPGGMTVYAVDDNGEPACRLPFRLRLSRHAEADLETLETIAAGGEQALQFIRMTVETWVRRQITSTNPNPWLAIAHHLRPYRLVEETGDRRSFLRQAARGLLCAASIMEAETDILSQAFIRGATAAAGRCAARPDSLDLRAIILLLSQISRHFIVSALDKNQIETESIKKRAAGEMLYQISWQGEKLLQKEGSC